MLPEIFRDAEKGPPLAGFLVTDLSLIGICNEKDTQPAPTEFSGNEVLSLD
jgi:hypothetical protein